MRPPTVAEMFPARTQPDGRTWYRPANGPMGWTANPEYADPSYFTDTEETPMPAVELSAEGEPDTGRYTEHSRYPLPPELPRPQSKYDGWGRYKLPSPTTGRPTGYTRMTTAVKVLEDTFNLSRWSRRETARRVFDVAVTHLAAGGPSNPTINERAYAALVKAFDSEETKLINDTLDILDNNMGGKDAAELGDAVHAWLGAVDAGMITPAQVPEMFQPYLKAYTDTLARFGLIPLPDYVERTVLNTSGVETIAGTMDRVYLVASTGALITGDVKTSKSLEWSHLSFGGQVAGYRDAELMLSMDGKGWVPMVETDEDTAIIMHIPSDRPEKAQAVTVDLDKGREAYHNSLAVRAQRSDAKKTMFFTKAIPVPTDEGLARAAAWQALTNVSDPSQLGKVWEQYQHVWTDELTAFGRTRAEHL